MSKESSRLQVVILQVVLSLFELKILYRKIFGFIGKESIWMEYSRQMVYFSVYQNGERKRRAGYMGLYRKGTDCSVQIYYREDRREEDNNRRVYPVYLFQDGSTIDGVSLAIIEGMATECFETNTKNFLSSGKSIEELETVYIEGVLDGVCGGRLDGQELFTKDTYSVTKWIDKVTEVVEEKQEEFVPEVIQVPKETWSLPECMERLPEIKLPFDGIRRKCCRMTLDDMEHLPKEWVALKNNHFLLHGFYEYHHLLLAKLCSRHGERFVLGVPGQFGYRDQYMAENFGFQDFSPLEQGKKCRGSFGYWYFYLERNKKHLG